MALKIEEVTLINGTVSTDYDNDCIISLIENEQRMIDLLEKVAGSEAIDALITKHKSNIITLSKFISDHPDTRVSILVKAPATAENADVREYRSPPPSPNPQQDVTQRSDQPDDNEHF